MTTYGLHPFEAEPGVGALCTEGRRVAHVLLPRRSVLAVRRAAPVLWRGVEPARAPAELAAVTLLLSRYLAGDEVDPATVRVALSDEGASPVFRAAWRALRKVRRGRVVTYGDLAVRAGYPAARRAIGQAVSRNPFPLLVPCHRVVSAASREGRLVAPGGVSIKRRLLRMEGHRKVVIGPG